MLFYWWPRLCSGRNQVTLEVGDFIILGFVSLVTTKHQILILSGKTLEDFHVYVVTIADIHLKDMRVGEIIHMDLHWMTDQLSCKGGVISHPEMTLPSKAAPVNWAPIGPYVWRKSS